MANALDILEESVLKEQARDRERTQKVVGYIESNDPKVLPMRTGSDGVGASAAGTGESVSDIALSRLAHRLHPHS